MLKRAAVLAFLAALVPTGSHAGEFERLDAERIAGLTASSGAKSRRSITHAEIEGLPAALADSRSALLLVKTGQGNLAKLLVTPALRKAPGSGSAAPAAVLVLDQYETLEPGKLGSRTARGTGTVLFEGFEFDLDSGIVVPPGQGGDLVFRAGGPAGPRLEATPDASLFSLNGPIQPSPRSGGPTPGRAVVPGDFSGRFLLRADGRFQGTLELKAGDDRTLTGVFRSEPNGGAYPVSGQVEVDPPHKAVFTVKFPRSEQEFEAFLWTEGKSTLAGTFRMLGKTYGFYAEREGSAATPAR